MRRNDNSAVEIRHFFKKLAPVYGFFERILHGLRADLAGMVKKKNSKILDVACGTGTQAIVFATMGHDVTGIDLSPDMLAKAAKKVKADMKLKLICKDASKLPFKDSSFDVATISFGLHEMPQSVGFKIIKEMRRVTRKDGIILLADYTKKESRFGSRLVHFVPWLFESKYYHDFAKVGLEAYVKKAGLIVTGKKPILFGCAEIVECRMKQ